MDMQDYNFVIVYFNSTRDKPKLGYRGFVYQKHRNRGETTYWKCERREDCNGRLITKEGKVTKQKAHNHAPDASVARIQKNSTMKETMKNGSECTSATGNRHLEEVQREFRPYFPSEGAIKRTLQRCKWKVQPALPQSLNDVNINSKYGFIYFCITNFKPQYLSP